MPSVGPDVIARTPRLVLRPLTPDDAPGMFALNADPEVLRYTGDPPFADVDHARRFLQAYDAYRRHGFGRWAVDDADGAFLGWCGPKRLDDGDVELGFRFHRAVWGRGFATEAARAAAEVAFTRLGIDRLLGRAAIAHVASHRVLEKAGFTFLRAAEVEGLGAARIYERRALPAGPDSPP